MEKYTAIAAELRKQLHLMPERSMCEVKTKAFLMDYLRNNTDLEIADMGSWFYAKWSGDGSPALCLRADYDAVTDAAGVSRHLCGHDGHAAVLAAFGKWISDTKPAGSIILLFQPGEESGEGSALCSEVFALENIGAIYGFHNIPGAPEGMVLLRRGTFACASTGLEIRFEGKTTHAAYPEHGVNPAGAIAGLIMDLDGYIRTGHDGIVLSTVIGIDLGSSSYGVAASEGVLRLTVRAEYAREFADLLAFTEERTAHYCAGTCLRADFRRIEEFPSTENHIPAVERLERLCREGGLEYYPPAEPFRWSEDFGRYLQHCPGAFFGVGAGENSAEIHTAGYEYNDAVSGTALKLYRLLAEDK